MNSSLPWAFVDGMASADPFEAPSLAGHRSRSGMLCTTSQLREPIALCSAGAELELLLGVLHSEPANMGDWSAEYRERASATGVFVVDRRDTVRGADEAAALCGYVDIVGDGG